MFRVRPVTVANGLGALVGLPMANLPEPYRWLLPIGTVAVALPVLVTLVAAGWTLAGASVVLAMLGLAALSADDVVFGRAGSRRYGPGR